MKVWLVAFAVLFVLAEFYLWVKDFFLPLPIYILGGAFLAIASNYERGIFVGMRPQSQAERDYDTQTATLVKTNDSLESKSDIDSLPSQEE